MHLSEKIKNSLDDYCKKKTMLLLVLHFRLIENVFDRDMVLIKIVAQMTC